MLRLKMATDPKWANVAENNLEEILIDHAYCEQKAASSAISLIVQFPEYDDIVFAMSEIAIEEMEHFKAVHKIIIDRGFIFGSERKDYYVNNLSKYFPQTHDRKVRLIYKLLFSAMIEARSCERFHLLSTTINDLELSKFYHDLEISEAKHYTVFLNFAKKYGRNLVDVDKLWEEFLAFEGKLIQNYGREEFIHG